MHEATNSMKSMKIHENPWKSMKIHEINENQWKSMKSMKINEINENHGFSLIFMDFHGFSLISWIFIDLMDFHILAFFFVSSRTWSISPLLVMGGACFVSFPMCPAMGSPADRFNSQQKGSIPGQKLRFAEMPAWIHVFLNATHGLLSLETPWTCWWSAGTPVFFGRGMNPSEAMTRNYI